MGLIDNYKTFAFISYSHRDMKMAKWLQRQLESFKLPSEVHNDVNSKTRYLRPVFRDQSDLNTGILSNEIRKHLEESKFLIVICSKNSTQSKWVSDETKAFVQMGRLDRIIPVIIPDGETPEKDLFPIYLREYFKENPDKELLGINIGEVGKEKALIRVISRMLDVSFDSLWKRHIRSQRTKRLSVAIASVIATLLAYIFMMPAVLNIHLTLQESNLPNEGNISVLVDGSEYTVDFQNPNVDKISLPGYKRFKNISVEVETKYFIPVDTIVKGGMGIQRNIDIGIIRDDSFATFAGTVYDPDMQPLEKVLVIVGGQKCLTDQEGNFHISLPISIQRPEMQIYLEKEGYTTLIRADECPSKNLKYILHK